MGATHKEFREKVQSTQRDYYCIFLQSAELNKAGWLDKKTGAGTLIIARPLQCNRVDNAQIWCRVGTRFGVNQDAETCDYTIFNDNNENICSAQCIIMALDILSGSRFVWHCNIILTSSHRIKIIPYVQQYRMTTMIIHCWNCNDLVLMLWYHRQCQHAQRTTHLQSKIGWAELYVFH